MVISTKNSHERGYHFLFSIISISIPTKTCVLPLVTVTSPSLCSVYCITHSTTLGLFILNHYYPYVANKMVEDEQCTIFWYVDDNEIQYKKP